MDWKTMLAYVTGSVDENLMLRIEYLVAENLILRDQIKGRVQLSDAERQTLAEIGAKHGETGPQEGEAQLAAEKECQLGRDTTAAQWFSSTYILYSILP